MSMIKLKTYERLLPEASVVIFDSITGDVTSDGKKISFSQTNIEKEYLKTRDEEYKKKEANKENNIKEEEESSSSSSWR